MVEDEMGRAAQEPREETTNYIDNFNILLALSVDVTPVIRARPGLQPRPAAKSCANPRTGVERGGIIALCYMDIQN